jgi:regulator of protease activity HflC (stomatin/prohibitin superfamily)
MIATVIFSLLFLLAIIGIGVWVAAVRGDRDGDDTFTGKLWGAILTIGGIVGGLIVLFSSIFVSNGIGEAKVYINPDGTIADTQLEPGFYTKAPWQDYVDFDLFSQEVLYAGGGDGGPAYSGGTVNGQEVTVAVGGISGGSTQANVDISITYSVDAEFVETIYGDYRNQERFTKQIIEKTILSTIRQIPSQYSAVEFRGDKRQEATDKILALLNEKLNKSGVDVGFVSIQDVRFPKEVEAALKDVETANQGVLKAEAEQRTAEVAAQTARIKAQGEADAIAIRNSTAPNDAVLRQLQIEAYGAGTVFVVPEDSTPFVTVK